MIYSASSGGLDNTFDSTKHYGLSRQAIIMVEAYKVLKDWPPYPPDQVIKQLEGFNDLFISAEGTQEYLFGLVENHFSLYWVFWPKELNFVG